MVTCTHVHMCTSLSRGHRTSTSKPSASKPSKHHKETRRCMYTVRTTRSPAAGSDMGTVERDSPRIQLNSTVTHSQLQNSKPLHEPTRKGKLLEQRSPSTSCRPLCQRDDPQALAPLSRPDRGAWPLFGLAPPLGLCQSWFGVAMDAEELFHAVRSKARVTHLVGVHTCRPWPL